MIGTIRKHQTWLWAVIITVTVISFVVYFSPYSKLNNARRGPVNRGSINGRPISEEAFANAWHEVELEFFFRSGGGWPSDESKRMGWDQIQQTYQWLLLLAKEDQFGIHLSADAVAQAARNMLSQLQRAELTPDIFERQVLNPHNLGLGDFERFVRHYLGVQELIATMGLSGKLITPQEAKAIYIRDNEQILAEAVFFSPSNHLAGVPAPAEAVSQFYTNQQANYRVPERVQVSYVKYGVSNYLAQAEDEWKKTNFTEVVESNFQRLGTNYVSLGNTPEEARAKIRETLIRDRALGEARKKALEFARKLFELEPVQPENLEKLARTNGLAVGVSAPFDERDGPKELEVGPEFPKAAFSRKPDDPFAGPLLGRDWDGAYVIALQKRIPSEIPPLDKIRDRVVQDYKFNEAVTLALKEGRTFYQTLTNGLAQGKTFSAIAAEAKLKPLELPPFSLSTRSLPEVEGRLTLSELKNLALATPSGKTSELQFTRERSGVIVHVKSRQPPDEAKMKGDLPAFLGSLRLERQNQAFNEWFNQEWQKNQRGFPLPRPSPNMSSGAAGS